MVVLFSSASGPQDFADAPQPESQRPDSQPGHRRALLERVLRQTLLDDERDGPLDEADRRALAEVARRHRGKPLTLEPVGVDLVQAVLMTHFAGLADRPGFWRRVSLPIAETLLDDPVARGRIETLWDRFCRE